MVKMSDRLVENFSKLYFLSTINPGRGLSRNILWLVFPDVFRDILTWTSKLRSGAVGRECVRCCPSVTCNRLLGAAVPPPHLHTWDLSLSNSLWVSMEFRRRARLFERKSSFLDRLRKKRNEADSPQVMKIKTKTGHIKEVNSNGVEIIKDERESRCNENSRKHRQV